MDKLTFPFIRFSIFLFGLLPFRVIYMISDFVFLVVYYIIRYRKKVVYKNLANSFPEKSKKEINKIAKQFDLSVPAVWKWIGTLKKKNRAESERF